MDANSLSWRGGGCVPGGWGLAAAPPPVTLSGAPGYPQEGAFLGVVRAHGVTSGVWGGRAKGFLWDKAILQSGNTSRLGYH